MNRAFTQDASVRNALALVEKNPKAAVSMLHAAADRFAAEVVPPFSSEKIENDSEEKTHFRISDGRDDRIATCHYESHANAIVEALNKLYQKK